MVKKIQAYFSYTFGGNIWRILASNQYLVTELREGARRKVDFAALDLTTGRQLWDTLSLPAAWWVSMVAIHEHILYLQLYAEPQKPEVKGIIAVDILTGKLLWQKTEQRVVQISAEGIVTSEVNEPEPLCRLLDQHTGEQKQVLNQAQVLALSGVTIPNLRYPTHFTHENSYFQSIVTFIKQILGVQPEKAVDYAEFHEQIIISYYLYDQKTLTNYLLILDQEAHVCLHEKIASQLPGIGLDTFFIVHNLLVVVKDKKELIAYEL